MLVQNKALGKNFNDALSSKHDREENLGRREQDIRVIPVAAVLRCAKAVGEQHFTIYFLHRTAKFGVVTAANGLVQYEKKAIQQDAYQNKGVEELKLRRLDHERSNKI